MPNPIDPPINPKLHPIPSSHSAGNNSVGDSPDNAANAVAEMVVSARAVSRTKRTVLWRCEEVVAREVNSFVPVPRGSGGLYNLASVAALDDKSLRKIFDGLADEAGRIVGRRVVNDSAN